MIDLTRRGLAGMGLLMAAVPAGARGRVAPPAPWGATPSPRQLAWHAHEMFGFVHFSINTFTDKEWGYGDESPRLFDPSGFDPDQIAAAAKAAGMRGLILTAKHHDGFCLWPTMLTEHCIRNAPYKGGRGDIVGELASAVRRAGLKFGIYLSPWDRNHAEYGRPAYIDYFRKQVVELCTRYGELFEFWFDGANGGDGYYGGAREARKIDAPAYYNWPSIVALVHRYQPMACTFDPLGADVRWVGNEKGVAGDPCWPTMPNHPYVQSEGNSGVRGAPLWWPAETDVSIRPGWFYHADEDGKVKDPERLIRLYDESVGRGTNLNLNIPADRSGRIPAADLASLRAFGNAMRATFARDLAKGAVAHASDERGAAFGAGKVLDGDRNSYWSTPDAVRTPVLTLDLAPGTVFDLIRLREYLPLGVRVTSFAVDAEIGGRWQTLASHSCIGAQRLIRLSEPIAARRIRLRILDAPACPAISEVALFRQVAPARLAAIAPSDPSILSRARWTIVRASAGGDPRRLLDDDASSLWTVPAPTPGRPAEIVIDLGAVQPLAGFTLTPAREPSADAAPPRGYRVDTSLDGRTWEAGGEGEFSNIAYALATQRIALSSGRPARFLRLVFEAVAVPARELAIADIGAFGRR
ncbi:MULTISPECIES: alpha-L-fucosidase [unclassified Sphingomonas]|uniref:alpha-L-fucosidase n=1 Tax=Sphingomonas TaxID=13687 RepID=UPI000961454F|nr:MULTISPECIES: alpha-L-fucosidase [unclassified Sphingomonas]MBN8813678.1 alpha-L-fucosidase [Sphingomonas sp.]OJY54098.1 MAG: alpha-L-fucosidase [Sphingomonas sp. 67-41]